MLLSEELVMVTISRENGGELFYHAWKHAQSGVAGALMMDLALQKRIFCRKGQVIVLSTKKTGDALLDRVMGNIMRSDTQKSIDFWVSEIHMDMGDLMERIIERLINKGYIGKEIRPSKFGYKECYPMTPEGMQAQTEIFNRIHTFQWNTSEIGDYATFSLMFLLHTCKMDKILNCTGELSPENRVSTLLQSETRSTKQYVKELLVSIDTIIQTRPNIVYAA